MPVQLRVYTINRGALQTFVEEWKKSILPLRERIGFRILNAWMVVETNQFVWTLAYDGPESWDSMDRAYHESDERKAMDPDPARHIARMENYFVDSVSSE